MLTRRETLAGLLAAAVPAESAPGAPLIDSHIHLFEPERFPYHANATYKPASAPLKPYLAFVAEGGIDHVIIVHPEPYQDDHSYLEYCFANEKPKGLFKGTCLFDAADPATPGRMEALARKYPRRIVALRIHAMNAPGQPPLASGPIKDRDLNGAQVKKAWAKAGDLGLAVQMHFLPHHAGAIAKLASEFRGVKVILDHLGRAGMGTPTDATAVLRLADFPNVWMKYSGWTYFKPGQAQPFARRAFEAFGQDRIIVGGLGHNLEQHRATMALFQETFQFAGEQARAAIRGKNAARLFDF
jgi:predicted TIM-barrel fold metal-dependent hydrolase